jgi:hypothetical protein
MVLSLVGLTRFIDMALVPAKMDLPQDHWIDWSYADHFMVVAVGTKE